MYSETLKEFKILLKILADLVDESIISEWQAGLIIGAYSMKNSIACFDFGLYSSEDISNIQNPPSETDCFAREDNFANHPIPKEVKDFHDSLMNEKILVN